MPSVKTSFTEHGDGGKKWVWAVITSEESSRSLQERSVLQELSDPSDSVILSCLNPWSPPCFGSWAVGGLGAAGGIGLAPKCRGWGSFSELGLRRSWGLEPSFLSRAPQTC